VETLIFAGLYFGGMACGAVLAFAWNKDTAMENKKIREENERLKRTFADKKKTPEGV